MDNETEHPLLKWGPEDCAAVLHKDHDVLEATDGHLRLVQAVLSRACYELLMNVC
jgi:hypothetical protein